MFGSALYYPYIDIPDSKWLRSAILFWDELKTIVPETIKDPYKKEDTEILWKEGFLAPLRCDFHPDLLNTLGKRVMSLMDIGGPGERIYNRGLNEDPNRNALIHAEKMGMKIRRQFDQARIYPEKLSPELREFLMRGGMAWVHSEKLSSELRDIIEEVQYFDVHQRKFSPQLRRMMRQSERLMDDGGEWLLVDSRFARVYMSALAAILAKETDLAALTNEESHMGINIHTILEDVKPYEQTDKKGALVSFVMETICVDPETSVEKILSFKRSRRNQVAELSSQFDEISAKIPECENSDEMKEKIQYAYVTKIRPKLDSLKKELHDNHIQSIWDGFQRAVTISIPSGGIISQLSSMNGTTLLAAGAAIAVADVSIKTHLSCRKARRASPYTYLLDLERKFSVKK